MLYFGQETLDRIAKLENLKKAWINPYPSKFDRTHSLIQAKESEDLTKVKVAWRIIFKRDMWKLCFLHLQDESGKLQIALQVDKLWVDDYKFFVKNIDSADFIWVEWEMFTTHKWEKSVLVEKWTLLTKSLLPLPEKFHGLHDIETKLRKRYLDILLNEDVKNMVKRRSMYFKSIRDFLNLKWFIEVDTPVLEKTTWWADANPFATHHDALDIDVYLRISVWELWQKRLMVSSLEKTFEVWRIFRNEWMSPEHAQDYTSMEVYRAYADYRQMMDLMKELYLYIVDTVYWKRQFTIRGFEVDFDKPWEEIDYVSIIKEKTWIDITKATEQDMILKLDKLNIKYDAGNKPRLIDTLWKYCRKQIAWPAFLINEPKEVSPLAKSHPDNLDFTQRFHIIIAWSEIWNWYSELNDPLDQKERFEKQQSLRDSWDDEAQMADWEFVEALMHGMPPTAWFGVSERFFAFLEDKPVREVQIFPLMKDIETDSD